MTEHCKQRQLERHFNHDEIMRAAVAPEKVRPSSRLGYRYNMRGRVTTVVHVENKAIVTVLFRHAGDYQRFIAKQEKEKQSVSA